MKAQELRIGNLISKKGRIEKIHSVSRQDARDYSKIEPIHLTEELLLKFGFDEKQAHDGIFGFEKDNFWYINEHQIRFNHGWIILDIKLKYVHQLQNLYFALTGEELTIKEP